ncbi:MAG TPA: GntR family transcriptional regulator [Ideonella sp.]|uniref:GntR family transcriptional regulator n=1 Tax=Ideonella sp. TaxID=1929293 RepID=UPI002E325440|nr:GntR family transcriptional regulator [Ideonella sp.]HEX5685061.1 GntR family transcriptional regulator [Ideonella sp.]
MPNATSELERFLDDLARDAQPGDQLPTIRELMRRFGASQVMVQRAFENLKARGLIASQVGRGTHFLADGRPASTGAGPGARAGANATSGAHARSPAVRSVLLLRRSISIARGRVLVESLQRRFTAEGHRVLEVSYTDPDHARTVLKSLPRFDACVVQSTYKTITIDLLAALREKSEVVAVDGAALVGTDVEAVGMEWGEPLAEAISLLQQRGHRRIACASTSHPFLATQLGWRRFDSLQKALTDVELHAIAVPLLPDQDYAARLVDSIKANLDAAGQPPFTALVAWGIEDGAKFRQLLADIGISVPSALSVVLLGRTDLANEHADFFDTVGCSVADQVESLYQAIQTRWADPARPYGVWLIPVTRRAGQSTAIMAVPSAGPPTADRSRARRSRS